MRKSRVDRLEIAVQKTMPRLDRFFTPETLEEFLQTPQEQLEKFNTGLGTLIRLRILGPRSELYFLFASSGIEERDVMTMVLLRAYHDYKSETTRRNRQA